MRRTLPPLNALLAFEAAARLQSFTRAASELGVAQPAVTRHVHNLEAWLDAPLFVRKGNTIRLTETGVALAELATAGFDRFEMGLRDLLMPRADALLIGASFGIMHLWLMPRITAMRGTTGATLNFVTAEDYRAFDNGAVDLSIRFGSGEFANHKAEMLIPERCYVLAAPAFLDAHPDLDPDNLPPSLRSEWLLEHHDPYDAGWTTWATWFSELGLPNRTVPKGPQMSTYPAMLDMVRHAEGLAIGSVGLDDDLVDAGELIRLGPPVSRRDHGYYLVYRDAAARKPGFEELRAALLAYAP